jgi:uncharacterized protein (TIGR02231 family)
MKHAFTVLLLLATSWSVAGAATYPLEAKIDAVTVFPQGADVFRVGGLLIPAGEHQLVLKNFPGDIDPSSIRVEGLAGEDVEIASVDVKPMVDDLPDANRKGLETQIETLGQERMLLDQAIADYATQRQFLLSMAEKQVTPAPDTVKPIDGAAIGGLMDVVGQRLQLITKESHAARLRQVAIDKEVAEFQQKLMITAPNAQSLAEVTINVAVARETQAQFKVGYRVWQAGWQPLYDAKLKIAAKVGEASDLEIVRRAAVTQSTAESWDGVQLTLSTARPNGATTAPEVEEEQVWVFDPKAENLGRTQFDRGVADSGAESAAGNMVEEDYPSFPAAPAAADKPKKELKQRQAIMELAGFQANYVIAGRVSVDNSGQNKRVRIASENLKAKLETVVSPRLDLAAYLTASFALTKEGPLLPGQVNLYRDGTYVGQGNLPLLNPGQDATLGFGADDLIVVERKEVKRLSAEEGILTSSNTEERSWDIVVKNLHTDKTQVTVVDRMPFSAREDVTVEPLRDQTPPTLKDYKKRRGVMAWTLDIDSKGESTVRTGYKITMPEKLKIGLAE